MRRAARAIVIKDDQLLIMHRDKFGTIYDTLPGGNVELGEKLEQALLRELHEETQVEVKNPLLVIIEHAGDPYGDQYVYLCEYVSGEPTMALDAEEAYINKLGKNLYTPAWLPLNQLPQTTFVSSLLKQTLLELVANGWPQQPLEISSAP